MSRPDPLVVLVYPVGSRWRAQVKGDPEVHATGATQGLAITELQTTRPGLFLMTVPRPFTVETEAPR